LQKVGKTVLGNFTHSLSTFSDSLQVYNGVLGDIQQGLYDTVAAVFTITPERFETFDFTTPIFPLESMFIVGPHVPTFIESSLKLFTIFRLELTATILISLCVILIGLVVTHSLIKERELLHQDERKTSKLDRFVVDASKQQLLTGKILILLFGGVLVLFPKLYESVLLTLLLLPPDPVRMTEKQLLDRVYSKELTFVIDELEYNKYVYVSVQL
jgi:hypothetical protein